MITVDKIQYMTVQEYANEKGVTIQTVYNWMKEKKVETKKLMGNTIIRL